MPPPATGTADAPLFADIAVDPEANMLAVTV